MFDVLPRLLSGFGLTHPQVKLVLHHDPTPAQVTALRQGRVVLVFERMLRNEPAIEIELVALDRVLVALDQSHRLMAKKMIALEDLRDEPMMTQAATLSQLANLTLDLCRANGIELKVAQLASDVVTGAMMGSGGCVMGALLARICVGIARFDDAQFLRKVRLRNAKLTMYSGATRHGHRQSHCHRHPHAPGGVVPQPL